MAALNAHRPLAPGLAKPAGAGWLAWLLAWLPWAWLGLLGLFVALVWSHQGALPAYGRPDPKHVGDVSLLYLPVMYVLLAALLLPALLAVAALIQGLRGRKLLSLLLPVLIGMAGWGAILALFWFDAFGLGNWLLD